MSKATILNEIAGTTGLARKDVASVMAELETIIERHLKKRAVGEFALPGLLKIKTVKKPAQRAKKGVPNPSSLVRPWTLLPSPLPFGCGSRP